MAAQPQLRGPRWTRLAAHRRRRGLSQADLAELTGVSIRTIQRIESRRYDNPPLRYLANCAIVLGCSLEDLIEPEWLEWLDLGVSAPRPDKDPREEDGPPSR